MLGNARKCSRSLLVTAVQIILFKFTETSQPIIESTVKFDFDISILS